MDLRRTQGRCLAPFLRSRSPFYQRPHPGASSPERRGSVARNTAIQNWRSWDGHRWPGGTFKPFFGLSGALLRLGSAHALGTETISGVRADSLTFCYYHRGPAFTTPIPREVFEAALERVRLRRVEIECEWTARKRERAAGRLGPAAKPHSSQRTA
jgi:hypothetical protein